MSAGLLARRRPGESELSRRLASSSGNKGSLAAAAICLTVPSAGGGARASGADNNGPGERVALRADELHSMDERGRSQGDGRAAGEREEARECDRLLADSESKISQTLGRRQYLPSAPVARSNLTPDQNNNNRNDSHSHTRDGERRLCADNQRDARASRRLVSGERGKSEPKSDQRTDGGGQVRALAKSIVHALARLRLAPGQRRRCRQRGGSPSSLSADQSRHSLNQRAGAPKWTATVEGEERPDVRMAEARRRELELRQQQSGQNLTRLTAKEVASQQLRQRPVRKKCVSNNNGATDVQCQRSGEQQSSSLSEEEDHDDEAKMVPLSKTLTFLPPRVKRAKVVATRSRKSKSQDRSSLLTAACYAMVAFLLVCLVASRRVLVLGQQPPAHFARSQPLAPDGRGVPLPPSVLARGVPAAPAPLAQLPARGEPQQSLDLQQAATGSLVAQINCNKIRGHVTLTPNLQAGGATVSTQITAGPPGEVYQWSIHQFPIKPGAAMCSCSSLILGAKLIDLSELHGNLPSEQEFSVQSAQLQLYGFDSPIGRSLLLRGLKTGMVACGTFLPTNRKSNYRAKFHTPLSGSVTIFQSSFGTSFLSHLMYSNGTRRHSTHRFDLVRSNDNIIVNSLLSGQPASWAAASQPSSRSLEQIEEREHENELQACRRFSTGEPLFKNATFQLAVSTENFGMRGRTALVLPQIPFETFSSVYVVVYSEHEPSEPIACAPLRFVKPKTAAAKFQTGSVQGSVVFSQDSPYDVTVARVNLNFPNSDGHSYGIDELPMIIRRKSDTRVCPNIREIIYNPHHIEPSSVPPEGEATSDQYAVGDLSGKYGSLTGKASEKITATDHNLPLFGPVSIIGRALTIYSADGVAIACSNVELTSPMTTAFATFDFGIQGQFIFRQPMNDCNGDTYVYIEVSKPTGSSSSGSNQVVASLAAGSSADQHSAGRSLDHNWHIHENPVDSGLEHLSTTECALAGPHFNPYNTSTSTIYSRDCTPFNVLRCELGDLSSKMFTIEIPPYKVKSGGQEPDIGKFFGTDIDLPLCGPASIVNRSVVVHAADFGHQRLACSTVIEFKPRT